MADPRAHAWSLATLPDSLAATRADGWFGMLHVRNKVIVTVKSNIHFANDGAEAFLGAVGDAEEIELLISSKGGDSDCALAVYRGIKGRVSQATVNGCCYSAAVTIAMAAPRIRIEAGATMMLHQPQCFSFGRRRLCAKTRRISKPSPPT